PSLPVKLVGSSAGLTQGPDGASHQSLEDIALMRVLPNMTVLSPADDIETTQMTLAAADWPGPVYLRVGRYPVPRVHSDGHKVQIGKITVLREGSDVVIFATGAMVWKSLEAAQLLAQRHVEAKVINVSTIKPLDSPAVLSAIEGATLMVSVEEHSVIGGLGSAIAECTSAQAGVPRLLRLGIQDKFGESGLADELLEKHGLQPAGIAAQILSSLS
ncbi:MAG: transketolase C-terminal domain-containing protein, partial [Acidobacteriota bacterium]